MPRARRNTNPFPEVISDRAWGLLFRWAEWRSVKGCPRSPRVPEPTAVWELRGGRLRTVVEGYCLTPSTRPPEPTIMDEFGRAFNVLEEIDRYCLLAIVAYQAEPWLKGENWQQWMEGLNISLRDCKRLLRSACANLNHSARRRGLA